MDVQFAPLSHLARSFSSQKVPTFREQTAASELHVNDVAGETTQKHSEKWERGTHRGSHVLHHNKHGEARMCGLEAGSVLNLSVFSNAKPTWIY